MTTKAGGCCAVCSAVYGVQTCETITCPAGTCVERAGRATRCEAYTPVDCDPNEPWNADWANVQCPSGLDYDPVAGQFYTPCDQLV